MFLYFDLPQMTYQIPKGMLHFILLTLKEREVVAALAGFIFVPMSLEPHCDSSSRELEGV